jgi:hypothetical protein
MMQRTIGMEEVWKPITGFEDRYEVSNFGRFRGLPRPIIYKDGRQGLLRGGPIKGARNGAGYLVVSLDSKTKKLAHRIVAEEFFGVPEYRATVNHKDGDKMNNRLDNLEWATYAENNAHARHTGLNKQHGENNNLAKYSDQFIAAMRNVHAAYNPTWEELGRYFGVTGAHARQIVLKHTRAKLT